MIPPTNHSLIITASLATSATILLRHRHFDNSAAAATSAVDSNPLGRVSETWGVWGASNEYKPVSQGLSL